MTTIEEIRDRIWADQTVTIERGRVATPEVGVITAKGEVVRLPVPNSDRRVDVLKLAKKVYTPRVMVLCYDGYVRRYPAHAACEGKGCAGCRGIGADVTVSTERRDTLVSLIFRPGGTIDAQYRLYARDLVGEVHWEPMIETNAQTTAVDTTPYPRL